VTNFRFPRLIHSSELDPKNRRRIEVLVPKPDGGHRLLEAEIKGNLSDDPSVPTVLVAGGAPTSASTAEMETVLRGRYLKYRIVHWSRPGLGRSEHVPGRRVVDAVDDVVALVNALNLSSFYMFGRSGGGPVALACAAEADRFDGLLRGVSVAAGQAPSHIDHPLRYLEMMNQNLLNFGSHSSYVRAALKKQIESGALTAEDVGQLLRSEKDVVIDVLEKTLAIRRSRGESLVEFLEHDLESKDDDALSKFRWRHSLQSEGLVAVREALYPDDPTVAIIRRGFRSPDRDFLERDDVRKALSRTYFEAVPLTHEGWAIETLSVRKPWGFSLEDISPDLPVDLHYFTHDRFVPPVNGRLLKMEIPHARLRVAPGGHFRSYEALPNILADLTKPHVRETRVDDGGGLV
jgi:pimeloyl-ACP methyl ester carboxylesterase